MKILITTFSFFSIVFCFVPSYSQAEDASLRFMLQQVNRQFEKDADSNLSTSQKNEISWNLENILNVFNGKSSSELLCTVSSNSPSYYRLHNGSKEIGNDSKQSECLELRKQRKGNLVCGRSFEYSSSFNVYNIETGEAIGGYLSLANCLSVVQNSTTKFVCSTSTNYHSYFSIYNINTGERIGGDQTLQNCMTSLGN